MKNWIRKMKNWQRNKMKNWIRKMKNWQEDEELATK